MKFGPSAASRRLLCHLTIQIRFANSHTSNELEQARERGTGTATSRCLTTTPNCIRCYPDPFLLTTFLYFIGVFSIDLGQEVTTLN